MPSRAEYKRDAMKICRYCDYLTCKRIKKKGKRCSQYKQEAKNYRKKSQIKRLYNICV